MTPDGTDALFFEECDSTNKIASDIGRDRNAHVPAWVIAGAQTAGRGRRGREWASKAGNLYASYVYRPELSAADLAALPYITALSVSECLIELGLQPEKIACKWPNDVLVMEQKISGILLESSAQSSSKIDFIVIGIGLNLSHYPADAKFPATSLNNHIGETISREKAFRALSLALHTRINAWKPDDISDIMKEWSQCAWGIGERRLITTAHDTFEATMLGAADDGGLKLRLDDGTINTLYSGDIFDIPQA